MRRKTSEWPPTDRQLRSWGQANRPNDSTFEHKKAGAMLALRSCNLFDLYIEKSNRRSLL